ncbi:MAG: hypothetical protein R2991_14930 [Thermoanaerobaculia bacterium]
MLDSGSAFRLRPRLGAIVLIVAWSTVAGAQTADPFAVHAAELEYQSAVEAMGLVHAQLSPDGVVELRGANGLVVRDHRSNIEAIRRLLDEFDHPSRLLDLELQVVQASTAEESATPGEALPDELSRRLRELLRYEHFTVLGHARVSVREREEVSYRLGHDYRVAFRLGAMLHHNLKLFGFQVIRLAENPGERQLLHTDLALTENKPMVLGLAPSESSDHALMVVLQVGTAEETP